MTEANSFINNISTNHDHFFFYKQAVGWGKTAEGVPSIELQEINLPYIPFEQCMSDVPSEFRGYVTPDKFCAGYLNGMSKNIEQFLLQKNFTFNHRIMLM